MSEKVSITVEGEFAKPSERPVRGDQRMVRYFPVGLPGTKGFMLPCIWMSPYEIYDEDLKEKVKVCIVLLNKGEDLPHKPDIIAIRIPSAAIHKFPEGPVEW